MPDLTVIIRCKDNLTLTKQLLDELKSHAYADWEAICLEHNSDSMAQAKILAWAGADQRIIPVDVTSVPPQDRLAYVTDTIARGPFVLFCSDGCPLQTSQVRQVLDSLMNRAPIASTSHHSHPAIGKNGQTDNDPGKTEFLSGTWAQNVPHPTFGMPRYGVLAVFAQSARYLLPLGRTIAVLASNCVLLAQKSWRSQAASAATKPDQYRFRAANLNRTPRFRAQLAASRKARGSRERT